MEDSIAHQHRRYRELFYLLYNSSPIMANEVMGKISSKSV